MSILITSSSLYNVVEERRRTRKRLIVWGSFLDGDRGEEVILLRDLIELQERFARDRKAFLARAKKIGFIQKALEVKEQGGDPCILLSSNVDERVREFIRLCGSGYDDRIFDIPVRFSPYIRPGDCYVVDFSLCDVAGPFAWMFEKEVADG